METVLLIVGYLAIIAVYFAMLMQVWRQASKQNSYLAFFILANIFNVWIFLVSVSLLMLPISMIPILGIGLAFFRKSGIIALD